jgi:hypothetical protein
MVRLKNVMGPVPCCSTAPKPEASQSMLNSLVKSGSWRMEDGCGDQGRLQRLKRHSSHRRPMKCLPLVELHERSCDVTVAIDELAVVACKTKKAADRAHRSRCLLSLHDSNLVIVHGDASGGDHMLEVCHLFGVEGALGMLDEQAMFAESLEDRAGMLQMGAPRIAID